MSGTLTGALGAVLGTSNVGGWMERFLRPASLRGRGFWIVAAEDETARRWITHEFPGRDDPWHEDLGAGPDALMVEGLLIGADVVRQAEAMRAAARAAGAATLVHPWYGTVKVVVLSLGVSHSTSEGRVARIRMKLQRVGTRPAPGAAPGLLGRVMAAIDAVGETVSAAIGEVQAFFQPIDAAVSTVLGIAGGVAGILSRGVSGAGLLNLLAGTASGQALAALAGLLPGEASSLTTTTARIGDAAEAVAALPADERNAPLAILLAAAADPGLAPVPADRSTPSLAAIADAAAALRAATLLLIAAEAARASVAAGWSAREDAVADRDALAATIEAAAEEAAALGWDDAWRAALALRAEVVAEISARAAPLPSLARVTLAVPLPASLVAHAIDATPTGLFDRGSAIAARNRARHPGFLPASRPIEVPV